MIVLALDPSTEKTGGVIGRFTTARVEILATACCAAPKASETRGSADMKRIQRIAHIRQTLAGWLDDFPLAVEGVAYEMHIGRGQAASEAGSQAVGAYLTISSLSHLPIWRIHVPTAKAVWGGVGIPTDRAKVEVVRWARREFGPQMAQAGIRPLSDDDDAIADAMAVLVATWGVWKSQEVARLQPKLTGPRGGKL